MRAMIMAAGVGSRLEPLTRHVPKPMVPVANRPVMEHIVNLLKEHQIEQVVANLHHLGHVIQGHFGRGTPFGIEMNYSEEPKLFGTAGGVKRNQDFLRDTFVVVSGDALTDINLPEMLAFHKAKGALATIALKKVADVSKFGVVVLDEAKKIVAFQEKPHPEHALSNLANTGIYIFEPEVFSFIPKETFYDFGRELFPEFVRQNVPFYGYITDEYWCDIGTIEAYRQANLDVLDDKVRVQVPGHRVNDNLWLGDDAKCDPDLDLQGKLLLGNGVKVSPSAVFLGHVIVGNKCTIGSDSTISDSVLWDGVTTETGVSVDRAIIGPKYLVSSRSTVDKGSVLVVD